MREGMTSPPLRIETLGGAALAEALPVLARLRGTVFAAWPYLYQGDPGYESGYLATLAASPGAAIVVAFDGDRAGRHGHLPAAGRGACAGAGGLPPARAGWRGLLLLRRERAAAGLPRPRRRRRLLRRAGGACALASACAAAAFCAVVRNANDPRRPADYQPLDGFWRRRGYVPRPDLSCVFAWKEVGDDRETPHSLGFWLKDPL